MRVELWEDEEGIAYVFDNDGKRHTIIVDHNHNHSAYLVAAVCSDEVTALVVRFNHLRPAQYDQVALLAAFKEFIKNPDFYEFRPELQPNKHMLRWLKLTESSATLMPIRVEHDKKNR